MPSLRTLLRVFYLTLAVLVIALAVLVQLGRNFSYLVADYRDEITDFISHQTGKELSLGSLRAEWQGLQPVLTAGQIRLASNEGVPILVMERARMRLDLVASVLSGQLVWSNVTFSGGRVALYQRFDGGWELRGAPGGQMSGGGHNQLVDILLASRRIAFERTEMAVQFRSGDSVTLGSPSVLVENRGDFHRLVLSLDVDERPGALYFIAESHGDPRTEDFDLSAYMQLRGFPARKSGRALAALVSGGLPPDASGQPGGRVNASLWLDKARQSSDYRLAGDLSVTELRWPLGEGELSLDELRAQVAGHLGADGQWRVGADRVLLDANGQTYQDLTLSLAGQSNTVTLSARELDLERLTELAQAPGLLDPNGKLYGLLQQLHPRGRMGPVALTVPLDDPARARIAARFDGVSANGWQGAPAVENVSGYVASDARDGFVELEASGGFSLHFQKVYDQPMRFESGSGRVAWSVRPEQNQMYVYSGPLQVRDGKERARGAFHLDLPVERNTGPVDLTILAGGRDIPAQNYRKYVPSRLPESVRSWLSESVGQGNPGVAGRAGFVFRGTINDDPPPEDRQVGLALDIQKADLTYHPQWPTARDLSGRLVLDDAEFQADIDSGRIYNSQLTSTSVSMAPNPQGEGRVLRIDGGLDGIASDGLRILRQSVLRRYVGDAMDSWFLHGTLQADVSLAIPLAPGAPGAYQDLTFDLDASTFALDNFGLELSDVGGRIAYHSDHGLSSRQLEATVFGEPLTIELDTERRDGADKTLIDAAGQASVSELRQWLERPELALAEGEAPFELHLAIDHSNARLALGSGADARRERDRPVASLGLTFDLARVATDLPAPLGKAAGEPGELVLNYILGTRTALADLHYLDQLRARAHLDRASGGVKNAHIALGGEPVLPTVPAFHISGTLDQLRPGPWQALWERYRSMGSPDREALVGAVDVPVTADLTLREQPLGPVALAQLRLQVRQVESGWDVLFSNADLAGELRWSGRADTPLDLAFSSLNLPPALFESAETGVEDSLRLPDTSGWPDADVRIDQISLAGDSLGQWQFELRPGPEGLTLQSLNGQVRGLTVGAPLNSDAPGARLFWRTGEQPATQVEAGLDAGNLAEVLRQWNAAPNLESKSAHFDAAFRWPGHPGRFSLESLEGQLDLTVREGRFLRDSAGAGEGFLRLMGLFNFDSIARRLRLDFSDLYQSGLAFDKIEGRMAFDEGQLTIARPLKVESPSSKMQLTGEVDLINETLDTRLVATLPVAGNLTVITALAAGLPAAAGVYLVSKLFEDQVDKATSVTYRISGSWDNPKMKFDELAEGE